MDLSLSLGLILRLRKFYSSSQKAKIHLSDLQVIIVHCFIISGSSGRVYSKRDLYERGHVAVCSHRQVYQGSYPSYTDLICFRPYASQFLFSAPYFSLLQQLHSHVLGMVSLILMVVNTIIAPSNFTLLHIILTLFFFLQL